MRHYLVVANETLDDPLLAVTAALRTRPYDITVLAA